ncbi:GNAT family N-acetyltransferase [Paenibacillus crassostreae]|uniref:Histone acetyltransferase n=1 Tax=Paenibacillus crassostreae TaxID=1763538 RepID=A0A167ESN0_9BACL|nr:GNAT family N-acetyltransferase [Paenibacillus crassostreae]AOZ93503.1 histone acetyltransferase [Paenibacillus crassostreae]OAB75842.1 histone acetyltransferase [Paenibacillus crassostreae]
MIMRLSLSEEDIVHQIWRLQQVAYRLEAEKIGFKDIPPLLDTIDTLSQCGETFFGEVNEDGVLQAAIAINNETIGTMTITRMMVHPEHFRKGIAGRMIQYIFEQYSDIPLFIVSTGTRNIPAYTLYLKYGFIPFDTYEVAPDIELTTFHRHL